MNNPNYWSDGVILAWITGGLAAVFIFFILYDSYRIKRRMPRSAHSERNRSNGSEAGDFGIVRKYPTAIPDAARVHADRQETLQELHRRYEASFNDVLQRHRDVEAAFSRIPKQHETVDSPK